MSAAGRTPSARPRRAELRPVSVELGQRQRGGFGAGALGQHPGAGHGEHESQLPRHLRGTNSPTGWLTAEYACCPAAPTSACSANGLYPGGRTQEIQRLVGRALRSCVDLALFRGKTLTIDTDVLVADGGTRCAAILAGYLALHDAADRLVFRGEVDEWPLLHEVAAVSVGVVGGEVRVDLDYEEDAAAEVDLNVVATDAGEIVEVQGGSESRPVPAEQYVTLIATGVTAAQHLLSLVRPHLG